MWPDMHYRLSPGEGGGEGGGDAGEAGRVAGWVRLQVCNTLHLAMYIV